MGRRYRSPDRHLTSDDGYVYHATNTERLADIADDGLRTHEPWDFTDQDAWPDGSVEKRSYFSASAGAVWAFAPEEGEAVIIRVAVKDHPFKRESTGDVYSTKTVPPSKIEVLTDEGWARLG